MGDGTGRDDAVSTVQAVRGEMTEAGMFGPLTPEGEHHRAVVKGILAHYDEHEAAGTEPDACCDALAADEEAAWEAVVKSEELLAARIACLESHDDTDDMDTGCLALLELEAALDAEERLP